MRATLFLALSLALGIVLFYQRPLDLRNLWIELLVLAAVISFAVGAMNGYMALRHFSWSDWRGAKQ